MVAVADEGSTIWPAVEEADVSMHAAAEVVDAMALAEIGRGWSWLPSYVVISMDMSSAHL